MKKLIAIGATLAVAYGASAGYKGSSAFDFEGSDTESFEVTTGVYDAENITPVRWHSEDGDATLEVKEYGQDAKYSFGAQEKYSGNSAPGDKYLAIEASKPLYRTPGVTGHGYAETTNMYDNAAAVADNGVFVDTLVKFTATESLEVPELDGGKIAVWLGTDENAPSVTNLYVTAAAVSSSGVLTPANFQVTTGGAIDPSAWHRLTIRAIPSVGTDASEAPLVGFTVFVDTNQVAYVGNDYASYVSSDKVDGGNASAELAAGKLFIGCVAGNTLEAVGFKGTGSIDDVTFADYASAPVFAKGAQFFTFSWNAAEIDAITIGSYQLSAAELATGSYKTNLITGTIGITVDFAEGYTGTESDNVTLSAGGTYAITATAAKFAIGNNTYADFARALGAAVADDTIKLLANVTDSTEIKAYAVGVNLTLDLNGKSYTVTAAEEDSIFEVSGATLKILDSVGGGVLTCLGTDAFVVYGEGGGKVIVGAASGDAGVTIVGALVDVAATIADQGIVKGKFDKASNGSSTFAWATKLVANANVDSDSTYWLVNMGGSQQATGWDIVPAANATAAATWGSDIPAAFAAADAAKLKTWATGNSIAFNDLAVSDLDAFLLNCALADVETEKAAFKLSITFENGAPVVSVVGDKQYNVDPVIKGKAALSDASWGAVDSTTKFYQAFLELPAVE